MGLFRATNSNTSSDRWSRWRLAALALTVLAVTVAGATWAHEAQAFPPPFITLTVEEYPIAPATDDQALGYELREQLPAETLAARAPWRERDFNARLDRANKQLAPFGYKLIQAAGNWPDRVNLMRGSSIAVSNTSLPYRTEINQSRSDFAMVIENTPNAQPTHLLVRKAGLQAWDPLQHSYITPAFLGDDLLVVDAPIGGEITDPVPYKVKRNDGVIYEGVMPPVVVDNKMKGLWGWDGHWALEVDEQVVLDGVSLSDAAGYDKVYGFRLIVNQPFYFFERGGRVGMSYVVDELPQQYDEVAHYQCCEAGMFNPMSNETMVWFWARRDGAWWYVEAGFYE